MHCPGTKTLMNSRKIQINLVLPFPDKWFFLARLEVFSVPHCFYLWCLVPSQGFLCKHTEHETWQLFQSTCCQPEQHSLALRSDGTGELWGRPKHFAALKCSAAAKRRHSYKPLWFWPLFYSFLPLLFQLFIFYLSPPHLHRCISLVILSPTPTAGAKAGAALRDMCTWRYFHPFWMLQFLPELEPWKLRF